MKRITETLVCTFLFLASLWPVSTLSMKGQEVCVMPLVKLRQIGLRVSPTASLNGSKLGVIVSHHG